MKKIFFYILLSTLFGANSFAQKTKSIGQDSTLTLKIHDFGKCGYISKQFYLTTGIAPKYITSAFYFPSKDTTTFLFIPINDKVFNYEYFQKYIYPFLEEGKEVKLTVKKYWINRKEILVASKIE